MDGYRNTILAALGVGTSAWLIFVGIQAGSDLLALATAIGAKDAALGLAIFGRGYNKKATNGNGK